MKKQILTIAFRNLTTNEEGIITLFASNPFMLLIKLNKFLTRNLWVNSWNLTNNKWEAGNKGMNAEAYLWDTLEELKELY